MSSGSEIVISFNGEERAVRSRTVGALLEEFKLGGQRLAVELNKEIIPRETFNTMSLSAGDTVEVVQFVGGG